MPVAIITGASHGLGRALALELAGRGWSLVVDARHEPALIDLSRELRAVPHRAVVGDVTDADHRRELVTAAADLGGLSILVNNASTLGASPMPRFTDLAEATYLHTLSVNVVAPMALVRDLLPALRAQHATVVNITSDAAVEAYEGWGAYGSAKAALDHASRILATEEPDIRVLSVDPGDMRTAMHQDAFPGEDISDRPLPETVAPRLADLILGDGPGGRTALPQEVTA